MATKFEKLLADLLAKPDKSIVIAPSPESALSGIRRGLKTSLLNFNNQMELMDLPTVKGVVSVSNRNSKGHVTVKIIDTTSPQYSFQYTIINEEEDDG